MQYSKLFVICKLLFLKEVSVLQFFAEVTEQLLEGLLGEFGIELGERHELHKFVCVVLVLLPLPQLLEEVDVAFGLVHQTPAESEFNDLQMHRIGWQDRMLIEKVLDDGNGVGDVTQIEHAAGDRLHRALCGCHALADHLVVVLVHGGHITDPGQSAEQSIVRHSIRLDVVRWHDLIDDLHRAPETAAIDAGFHQRCVADQVEFDRIMTAGAVR
mmetsp:Transcript_18873/g.52464  ORF Transcript_18873/g.52464 Transcript_18873/m.52464 type:complete len:214 (-) Transcript_18873:162-803(-)